MTTKTNSQHHVTLLAGAAYALPVIPVSILMSTNNVLSGLYATHHGLALSSIAMVMLIAGIFDAVTDPLIGYFSDRYHARTGTRKPFIIGGALLSIISAYFLFIPIGFAPFDAFDPGEIGHVKVSSAYFLCALLSFYFAYRM